MNQIPEPLHRGQKLNWNYPINLIGEKVTDPVIHSCEICDLPILIYGRVLPCKHVFCHDCSSKAEKHCPRCKDPVNRIERCELGTIFLCTWGAPRHSQEGCRRTYLSQRDLQAHVNHRHAQQKPNSVSSLSNPSTSGLGILPNVSQQRRDNVGSVNSTNLPQEQPQMGMQPTPSQPWQQQQQQQQPLQQSRQGTRGNLITIQLQGDNTRLERRNPTQRSAFR